MSCDSYSMAETPRDEPFMAFSFEEAPHGNVDPSSGRRARQRSTAESAVSASCRLLAITVLEPQKTNRDLIAKTSAPAYARN